MKQIKELTEHIERETKAAHCYAETALAYKETDRDLAETYSDLARAGLDHADMLHSQAVRLIRASGETAPPEMLSVWDYLHRRHIEAETDVRRLLEMYRR